MPDRWVGGYLSAVTSVDPIIAVVDDEAPVRVMLGRLLRLANYGVSTFASGEEFLSSLTRRMPTCVVLDVHMPGMSGLEVQSRLYAARIRIPIVFITASDDAALDRSTSDLNAVCLLRKPFGSDALLDAVQLALARRDDST